MRQRERVAELRRDLPQGAPIQDYQFEEGPRDLNAGDAPVRTVRLSETFHQTRSLTRYLSLYVWQKADQGVPHVHSMAGRRRR